MQQESNRILFLGLLFLGLAGAFTASAQAICPICVVAIGAGLGFSRWLKIDDLVSSVWIGAFLWTLVVWTLHWMRKKNWGFKFDGIVTFLFYYSKFIFQSICVDFCLLQTSKSKTFIS